MQIGRRWSDGPADGALRPDCSRASCRRHQSGCWSQGSSRGSGQVSSFFEGTTSQRAARVLWLNKSSNASADSHVDIARTAKEKGTLTMPVNVPARAGDEIRTRDVQLGKTPILRRVQTADRLVNQQVTSHRRDSCLDQQFTGLYRFNL
jgi:hypothetical protein